MTINTGAMYNYPFNGSPSDAGEQIKLFEYHKFYVKKHQADLVFGSLTSEKIQIGVNTGRDGKFYEEIPVMDERNVGNQGIDATGAVIGNQNLSGSSLDIGDVKGALPHLKEDSLRVNRIGFSRIVHQCTAKEYGMFFEHTRHTYTLDTQANLYKTQVERAIRAMNQLNEYLLQLHLLDTGSSIRFTGNATSISTVTGEGADPSLVDLSDFESIKYMLDEALVPDETTIVSGANLTDTRTVAASRFLFVPAEVVNQLKYITDPLNGRAFIPVEQYAGAASDKKYFKHEVGAIGGFRIVKVPKMLRHEGAGAAVVTNPHRLRSTGGKYDVFPMLCVGQDAFVTVGMHPTKSVSATGDGASYEFIHKPASGATAQNSDPYGVMGFTSIQWQAGFYTVHPEYIAIIYTCAKEA